MPPKLEQGGICGGCLGGHRYQLKAVEVLVTWHLWSHVAMDDGAPGTHAHWVMVLKQGCELGQELTVQLEAAVCPQEGRHSLDVCRGQLACELDRWPFEPGSENGIFHPRWRRCGRKTTDQVP